MDSEEQPYFKNINMPDKHGWCDPSYPPDNKTMSRFTVTSIAFGNDEKYPNSKKTMISLVYSPFLFPETVQKVENG